MAVTMMDHSSQVAVIPSESLHDILKCELELEEENGKLLETGDCVTLNNETEGRKRSNEVILFQKTKGEQVFQDEDGISGEVQRRPTQSSWSQTCRHQQSVKIDLTRSDSIPANNKKLTLVRGSSLSLVDLPTFLPSTVRLGKLANISSLIQNIPIHRQLQQATRKEARRGKPISNKTMGKKSQWTVMCVALGFFTSCLILVGSMLSITSEYQDQAIARMLNMSLEDIERKG